MPITLRFPKRNKDCLYLIFKMPLGIQDMCFLNIYHAVIVVLKMRKNHLVFSSRFYIKILFYTHLLPTKLVEGELLTPVCHCQNVIVFIPVK